MIKIAIIGAGVSGLTTAWYLRKKFSKDEAWIKVYDKSDKVGGNADTMKIFLKDGTSKWVDMGVNDFNKLTYKNMVALWTELGIIDTYCKPLVNEESFWKGGTSNYKYWVDDNGSVHAEGSEAKDDAPIIEKELEHFKEELAIWYRSGVKNPNTTVGEWVKGRFDPKFINNNLYPRINGMYYAQEYSQVNIPPPSLMPLWMVAHYYILQEGYGHDNAAVANARQYFVNGSTTWLNFLRDRLRDKNVDVDSGMSKGSLNVQKDVLSGNLAVVNGSVLQDIVDIVIFATHAEDTQKMIQFPPANPPMMIK
jgi:protoporphyrinogen oxidase